MFDKERIRAEVMNLGFSLVGFTTPEPLPSFPIFEQWVKNDFFGEMTYLARADTIAKRSNPRLLMPEVKTIIVLAASYPPPIQEVINDRNIPGVAAYARLQSDYHALFQSSCAEVIALLVNMGVKSDQINQDQESKHKIFADTAPIMEKALAQRAGMGWIGRNGCLINPEYGSWLLLAEIFTSLEITPDIPFSRDLCGNCSKCITACPTNCIQPDRTLNAPQCSSYLTIEHRSDIPVEVRPALSNQVFGCDICQQVCPWNGKSMSDSSSKFTGIPGKPFPLSWQTALEYDAETFQKYFGDSPISRIRWDGWLRNCLIGAGNSEETSLIPLLASMLTSNPSAMVRRHTIWALLHCAKEDGFPIFRNALVNEKDESVRAALQTVLAE